MLKTRILMPGQIAVSKAEVDKLNAQWAEVQAVLNVDVFEELEKRYRRGYLDPSDATTDHHMGFYDGMLFVLNRIKSLRDENKKSNDLPF